jgi:hypothetical protein
VFPCGMPVPATSNLNFGAGQTIANSDTATVGDDGKVCLFAHTATHLVVDLNAAYSPTVGTASLLPLVPVRLLDTRDGGVKAGAGTVTELLVTGSNGVPADAAAVVLNVTASDSDGPGFVTVFPCGMPVPATSNLNVVVGQTVAKSVTATVGIDGKVCLFTYVGTHLVVDLNGAYAPPA